MQSPPEEKCFKDFFTFINEFEEYVLVCHHNADPDTIGSAWMVGSFLSKKGVSFKIIAESYSSVSLKIINEIGQEEFFLDNKHKIKIEKQTGIIIFDTGDLSQLGSIRELIETAIKENPSRIFIFDHHETNEIIEKKSIRGCVLTDYYSTCEIIGDLFLKNNKIKIFDANSLTALLCGIIYDTQRFFRADITTFELITQLLKNGANYEKAIQLLTMNIEYPEKIARLKALQRMVLRTPGGIIIAMSYVSSYESSAARAIINNGADIAFVISLRKSEIRASIRARKELSIKIDFKKILGLIIQEFGGTAGGHFGAMGMNIPFPSPKKKMIPKIQKMFYEELLKELHSKGIINDLEE